MTKGHVHQALMAQYAEDAKETPQPWTRWQKKNPEAVEPSWSRCREGVQWHPHMLYRRVPNTVMLREHLLVAPVTELPADGSCLWHPNPGNTTSPILWDWFVADGGSEYAAQRIRRVPSFLRREDAVQWGIALAEFAMSLPVRQL